MATAPATPASEKQHSLPALEKLAGLENEVDELRPLGYASRLAQLSKVAATKISTVRHLAYASDVGEAFRRDFSVAHSRLPRLTRVSRPTVPRWAVNATYGVAVGYVTADVVSQTAKASASGLSDSGVARVATQTATFQLFASILAPFVAIHQTVHLTQRLLKSQTGALARYGPTCAGLALIPVLPIVDHPVEHVVERAFDHLWPHCEADLRLASAAAALESAHHPHRLHEKQH